MEERKFTAEQFKRWGRKGGKITALKGKSHYSKAGRKGGLAKSLNFKKKCQMVEQVKSQKNSTTNT